MNGRINRLKHDLAAVFDDNLHTRKWHNIADYIIIGMILLSTLEIFLSTFSLSPRTRILLHRIDIFTLIFFTIEVSLRIWVAPLSSPRYKGVVGRIRYCLTFNGFIDVISTYPFYLQWLMPFPVTWLKVLRMFRTVRLFRIARYMKSWRLLSDTIAEKRRELLISLQFLIIITFILSLILFFSEHEAQPDVYDTGVSSVLWAFAQYIGDPGGFAATPPITVLGRVVACIVGLLGIAIVAVPAGILGAGFTEAIEKEKDKEEINANREKLRQGFMRLLDRPTGCQVVPAYRTIPYLQARQGMTQEEIVRAATTTPGFRLVNLAATIPVARQPNDTLAVEHFAYNRPYGLKIDRGSRFTVIAPSSVIDYCTSSFAYYLAELGGFNLISREFGSRSPYVSLYMLREHDRQQGEDEYFADIRAMLCRPGAWSLTFLVSSGANEPEYDTQIHFGTGSPKGVETIGDLITDKDRFRRFYDRLSEILISEMEIRTDLGRYHQSSSPDIFLRKIGLGPSPNNMIMRGAWSAILWNPRRILIAETIARTINREILNLPDNPSNPEMTTKRLGFTLPPLS